jgi:peptide/nickel transport system substrate-binding protein
MKRIRPIVLIPLITIALITAACAPAAGPRPAAQPETATRPAEAAAPAAAAPAPPVAPPAGPPLVVLIDNDEGPITPANFNTFIGFWMTGWVYDPLFVRSPDLQPVPALATEATQSADGLTWTVKLREGVKWHDGQPFTARDVVFSYKFLVDAGRAQGLAGIDSLAAEGDLAVTIKLKAPNPFFLAEGLAAYYILPEHVWRDQQPNAKELSQFQGRIGTGPYLLQDAAPGESYTFQANLDYFRGPPRVGTIVAKIVKDRSQQFNQLRTDAAAAVLSSVPPALVGELEKDRGISLSKGSDFFNYVFYVNASRPPFDQAGVRRAIAAAIDADMLVQLVLLGQGKVLPLSYYHPDLPWSINIPRAFNPQVARDLLDQAGFKDADGDGIREWGGKPAAYEILCDANNPVEVRSTELIAGWLKDVGIGATQKCLDIDTVISFMWPGFSAVPAPDYDLAIFGWSSGPQFQRGFIRGLVDGDFGGVGWANLTGTSDAELSQMLAELVTNPDPARQEDLNRLIQQRFAEFLPFIPLMSPGGNFAYRPEAHAGWVYMRGTGIMTAWSFLPPDAAK